MLTGLSICRECRRIVALHEADPIPQACARCKCSRMQHIELIKNEWGVVLVTTELLEAAAAQWNEMVSLLG